MSLAWKKFVSWLLLGGGIFLISELPGETESPPPLDVVIVLDQSAALRTFDPDRQLLQSLALFLRGLPSNASGGLVIFGSQAWSLYPLSKPGEEARQELLSLLPQIRFADPETNPVIGLERGLSELAKGRGESRRILLLVASVMGSGEVNLPEIRRLCQEQSALGKTTVKICGIGLGTAPGGEWIQELVALTGGIFARAPEAGELDSSFQSVLQFLQQAVPLLAPSPPVVTPPAPPPVLPASPPSRFVPLVWVGALLLAGALAGVFFFIRRRKKVTLAISVEGPPPAARLVDLRDGKVFPIAQPLVRIGRKPDNDLVIPEATVSGHHAEILFQSGRFILRDLQSANTTKLNERKVAGEASLKNGDILRFDVFGFTFVEEAEEDRTVVRPLKSGKS
jgi:hypothetical protein